MAKKQSDEVKPLSFEKLRKITESPTARIHFVGIGGISMFSLARLAMLGQAKVSGSDREESDRTRELRALGAEITIGHDKKNVEGASVVVYTHAIQPDNPELVRASELEIPVISRAEYMGALMMGYNNRIGISGSHGKSTTVAMLDTIFSAAMCDPTVLSGAELQVGEPLKVGSKNLMIYEACEYKDSFLKFAPTISVGLNLELDHTDYFGSLVAMKDSFRKALSKATKFSVINGDDQNFRPMIPTVSTEVITYGRGERNTYQYFITSYKESGFLFRLTKHRERVDDYELNIPGVYNVDNAVAAIVTALEYGIDRETVRTAIATFGGIHRRLERVGTRNFRPVYYDYAHHPTEIKASINALKMMSNDLVTVIFKPHTYTRTKSLWEGFRMALSIADHVILTEIYPAREAPIEGVDSRLLVGEIGAKAVYRDDDDILDYLDYETQGIIVVMGAGDLEGIKQSILKERS